MLQQSEAEVVTANEKYAELDIELRHAFMRVQEMLNGNEELKENANALNDEIEELKSVLQFGREEHEAEVKKLNDTHRAFIMENTLRLKTVEEGHERIKLEFQLRKNGLLKKIDEQKIMNAKQGLILKEKESNATIETQEMSRSLSSREEMAVLEKVNGHDPIYDNSSKKWKERIL